MERRGPFGRPEDEYNRSSYEYEGGPRFFPNGGAPRNYHEDQRGYHGENMHFPAERRTGPPSRRVRARMSSNKMKKKTQNKNLVLYFKQNAVIVVKYNVLHK